MMDQVQRKKVNSVGTDELQSTRHHCVRALLTVFLNIMCHDQIVRY